MAMLPLIVSGAYLCSLVIVAAAPSAITNTNTITPTTSTAAAAAAAFSLRHDNNHLQRRGAQP